MKTPETQHTVHLRGDAARLEATAQEGDDWTAISIGVADPASVASHLPTVQLFWHHEPNGFTDEAIIRSVDDFMEAFVRIRTAAVQRQNLRRQRVRENAVPVEA